MPNQQNHEFGPERKTVGIVLLGKFNALLFHPLWFQKQNVFGAEEVDDVLRRKDEMICAPGLTSFHTSHILVKVEDYRFEITALKEPFGAALDACKKVFEGLETLTVTAMGINTAAHFRMPDVSTYHRFGDMMAPKDRWTSFLGSNATGDNRRGGLVSLSMMTEKQDRRGSRTIKVERSGVFSPPTVGIFVNCNDHFSFESDGTIGVDASEAMDILSENFDRTLTDFAGFQHELFQGL